VSRATTASADAVVVRAAAVLGLVWFGDALIYVVLPLHAEAFGIGLGWRWSPTGWPGAIGCLRSAALTPPGGAS
jgi:hypothetical protein